MSTPTLSSPEAACTTAVPDENGWVPIDACNSYYFFYPNFGINVFFAAVFALAIVAHLAQAFVYKKRYAWVIVMGALWEFVAFLCRALGAKNQQQMGYATAGVVLFLLAPIWINTFVYMTAARLIYFLVPSRKVWGIPALLLTRLFVVLEVVTFIVQAAGGAMMSAQGGGDDDSDGDSSGSGEGAARTMRIGQQIYMTGIGVQAAFILVFVGMGWRAWAGLRGAWKVEGEGVDAETGTMRKRTVRLVSVLCAVLVLIIIRIIFRIAEFGPGATESNPILTHEAYALVLDALPMATALFLLNAVHSGSVLRGPESEFPSRAEKKAEKKARKAAKEEEKLRKKEEKEEWKRAKKGGVSASVV